jgi:Do/DeqQ family serine protease
MKQIVKTFFIAAVGGIVSLGIYTSVIQTEVSQSTSETDPKIQFTSYTSGPDVPLESLDFVKASRMSVDAVVHVKTVSKPTQYYNPWSQFFGVQPYQSQPQRGSGSGVVISGDGYIVTNNHVIENAEQIEITTNNNRSYTAELIGADPATDIALLKIDEKDMPAIILGDSDNLQIGEWVLAVGNPFNLTSTVTAGIVSAKARNINILDYNPARDVFPLESFIQTDAAVNPGNSGGALVNGRGELVGINTAIASKTGSYSGYSFAIPVSIVQKVTADLLEFGKVQRAYIGVTIANIDPTMAAENDLKVSEGAYVRGLMEGGAAEEAGLEAGDIIVEVEEFPVKNVTQLQEQVGKFRPGDKINVSVLRNNTRKEFEVLLRDRNGSTELERRSVEDLDRIFGAKLETLESNELNRLNIRNGVKITDLENGKLKDAGLKEGFVITHIDKQPVDDPDDISALLKSKRGGVLVEGVHPNGRPDYFGFGIN